jgi:hypothetical protein
MRSRSASNFSLAVGCLGGVTGGHRRRILRIRLLRRAYRPVLARGPCRPQASRHPTHVTLLSIGTLNAVVLFHALAANSLANRGEGLRARTDHD